MTEKEIQNIVDSLKTHLYSLSAADNKILAEKNEEIQSLQTENQIIKTELKDIEVKVNKWVEQKRLSEQEAQGKINKLIEKNTILQNDYNKICEDLIKSENEKKGVMQHLQQIQQITIPQLQLQLQQSDKDKNQYKTGLNQAKIDIDRLEGQLKQLTLEKEHTELLRYRVEPSKQEINTSGHGNTIHSPINSATVQAFNRWAANPSGDIPAGFFYLAGEFKIRLNQNVNTTNDRNAKWICDKDKVLLFPNPNSFDQFTDISELYKMDFSKLQPKGKNKIKIKQACEMAASTGFINFSGELELLL